MMRRLILLRHAKSGWSDPTLADHDRPLSKRGKRSCTAIGKWMADRDYLPDQVLCSTSVRTVETWDRLSTELPRAPQPALLHPLYLADADTLIAALATATGETVALVAHNPGIAEAAHLLVENAPTRPEFARFPTLAALVLDFDFDDWCSVSETTGRTVDFAVPRDFTN